MKLKNIAIYALLTGGLSLPVMTSGIALSHAAEGTAGGQLVTFKPDAPHDAWKATQISAQKSKHPYCSVEARFQKSGATIVIARNKRGLNSLAIDFGKTLFEKGQTYSLMIGTDIGLERRFEARALSNSLLMAQVGQDKPFMRAIAYNGEFVFFVPETVRANFTLVGADNALDRLERCLSTMEEFIPPLADETYLREARAKVVKKRTTGASRLVDERGPSRTAKARIAQHSAPETVPVPPRKASMMNIKVTKVEPPVVYDEPIVSEEDSVSKPDMVEIARQEISDKIDELAAKSNTETKPGEAEEHLTISNKVVLASKSDLKKDIKKADTKTKEVAKDTAEAESENSDETVEPIIAVKKVDDEHTIVADVTTPEEDTPVDTTQAPVEVADVTPPTDDTLMTPMPGEAEEPAAAETAPVEPIIVVHKQAEKTIAWNADRVEVKDPAAKNIMALEKRAKQQPQAEQAEPVQTAERAPLLPTPDLSVDIPSGGAYFPEQDVASLTPADIEDAISVQVEKAPSTVATGTEIASLQAVSGPFDAAEYERLKKLAQAKHAQEIQAKEAQAGEIQEQQAEMVEPVSLMTPELQTETQIAEIATAAGEDLETAGMMMPEPGMTKAVVATDAPMDISFSSGGALSMAEYAALKARLNKKPAKQAAMLKQASLSDAINQLVPPEFQITVGNGLDMTQTVSWHEGDNWQDIIAETLGQVGAEARIKGSVVMLMSMAQ